MSVEILESLEKLERDFEQGEVELCKKKIEQKGLTKSETSSANS